MIRKTLFQRFSIVSVLSVAFVFSPLATRTSFAGLSVIQTQNSAPSPVPPQGAAAVAAPSPADQDDRDLKELIETQKKAGAQIDVLNQVNPQQAINSIVSGQSAVSQNLELDFSKLPAQFQFLRPVLESKLLRSGIQRMVLMAQTPQFQQAASAVSHNPNGRWMYVGMLLAFVVYAILKKRMLAATDSLIMRLVIRLAMFVLLLIAQFSIAFAVFGEPFAVLVQGWYKVFFG